MSNSRVFLGRQSHLNLSFVKFLSAKAVIWLLLVNSPMRENVQACSLECPGLKKNTRQEITNRYLNLNFKSVLQEIKS